MENTQATSKPKIVFAKLPNSPKFYACDYNTFKVVPGIELGKKTLPQCIEALKDTYEITGFLSYGMIIPLVGLIPGHESKRIEDVHERLLEAAADEAEEFKKKFGGPVELPSLGTVGESEAIPGLEQKES